MNLLASDLALPILGAIGAGREYRANPAGSRTRLCEAGFKPSAISQRLEGDSVKFTSAVSDAQEETMEELSIALFRDPVMLTAAAKPLQKPLHQCIIPSTCRSLSGFRII